MNGARNGDAGGLGTRQGRVRFRFDWPAGYSIERDLQRLIQRTSSDVDELALT